MRPTFFPVRSSVSLLICLALLASLGCRTERRKSDAELGLNATQAMGRTFFDANCARCHEPYSSRGLARPKPPQPLQKAVLAQRDAGQR